MNTAPAHAQCQVPGASLLEKKKGTRHGALGTSEAAGPGPLISTRIYTPLGEMVAAACDLGVCLLEFADRRALPTELRDLARVFGGPPTEGVHPHLAALRDELAEYIVGQRRVFEVPVCAPGTPMQREAWGAIMQIPFGQTRSYAQQASTIGRPKAVRAVARANGQNRISIVIPCHRVIGADGKLTGYGGGLDRKRWLLEHEGALGQLIWAGR
jgi:AraC family transcriptional regulator, regulatory protein of adaptative response / methylated-DNA-[protein]-cysteine methyltransferase